MIEVKFPILANYTVQIIVAENFNAARPKLIDDFDIPTNDEGCCITRNSANISFIFLKPDFTIGELAHEASHAINNVFRYIGAKSDEEIFAYHLQHLVDNTLKGLVAGCRLKKVKVVRLSGKTSKRNKQRASRTAKR